RKTGDVFQRRLEVVSRVLGDESTLQVICRRERRTGADGWGFLRSAGRPAQIVDKHETFAIELRLDFPLDLRPDAYEFSHELRPERPAPHNYRASPRTLATGRDVRHWGQRARRSLRSHRASS